MSEFIEHLHEVFQGFGPIHIKPMFGGHGVYHDGLMFALVADGILFLKADSESCALFRQNGERPFEYIKRGKALTMSYYTAPEAVFDDPEQARLWAERAFAAADRSRSLKSASTRAR